MGTTPTDTEDHYLFRDELVNQIGLRPDLLRLAELIEWHAFSGQWGPQSVSTAGRPAMPTRLMAALLYLKHVYALSDEDVVGRWVESPYCQHCSGERHFQHELR